MHKHYKISKCCHSDLFRDFLEPISILLVKVIIVYGKPYSLASVSVLQQSFSKKTLLTMTIFRASTDQWPILNQHIFTFWKFWEEVSGKFKCFWGQNHCIYHLFIIHVYRYWTLFSCEALCVFQLYPGFFCCILPSYLFFIFSERQLIHWI